ncbi:MAG: globin family protein [Pseudomonadota bacterium]
MDRSQIALVEQSFAKILPIKEAAAELFYGRLFEIAPDVKPMFKGDIKAQGLKLMGALTFVVNGLRKLDAVVPTAQELAIGHVGYGVKAEHYAPVGEALIWTLEQGLGEAFTEDVEAAWLSAYTLLSGVMVDAAYQEVAA